MDELRREPAWKERFAFLYPAARVVAVISAVFMLVVAILVLISYLQQQQAHPVDFPQLERLAKQAAEKNADPALRRQVRELDLLARRAYFSGEFLRGTGGWLLLGGLAVFLLAMKTIAVFRTPLPKPGPSEDHEEQDSLTRWALGGLGVALLVAALLVPRLFPSRAIAFPRRKQATGGGSAPATGKMRFAGAPLLARHWPGLRGALGRAVSSHTNIPTDWDGKSGRNIVWKSSVPRSGFSSPVVWGEYVFLSGGDGEAREVYCYRAGDGKLRWTRKVDDFSGPTNKLPRVAQDTGFAAASQAVDGERVYSIFATGYLVCHSFSGKKVWERRLGIPKNHYGHSSSLLILSNRLFVQFDDASRPRVLAVDAGSGRTLWRTARTNADISWASPILAGEPGQRRLILATKPIVTAYDPATGKLLWSLECLSGEVGPSPAYGQGIVFAANEYAKLTAIDLESGKRLWDTDEDLPEVSSPLFLDTLLFVGTSNGALTCRLAKTGKLLWKKEFETGFYASPVAAEGRVYLLDRKGVMRIFQAGPAWKGLGNPALGETAVASPAFAHNRIYLRSKGHLYCIGSSSGKQ